MKHPLDLAPSKIIATHLNYRSRASERGRIPEQPSYFLKPPSSLAASGADLVVPAGTELATFEGEIAVIIGRRASRVDQTAALDHIAALAPANDFGVHDLRYADHGSNLRSKGADGFTPVGPAALDIRSLDLSALRLRTWVNGNLVQDAGAEDLLFDFAYLIADLSRLVTLEAGDIILSGTPTGSTVVRPGDVIEVSIGDGTTDSGRLRNTVRESAEPLGPTGAQPRPREEDREFAYGAVGAPANPAGVTDRTLELLRTVSTATLSTQLRKRGLHNTFIEGVRPAKAGQRMVGFAHTLRYVPIREDLFAAYGGGMNAQKRAIEAIRSGQVLVIEARGELGAGTLGDILALRAARRGAVGVVTDGGLRDSPSFVDFELPTYFGGAHASVLGRRHVPWEFGSTIACGGVTVQPGDVLVGDGEGVIVLPAALAAEVAVDADEQERQEEFVYERVAAGESLAGLYPLPDSRLDEYRKWRVARKFTIEPGTE